ncbi:MutS-related protein [Halococcoides cellulosivorans]|uniref:DNA mismatch repair protein n=1 Tax=Halococcoides cellulosivorans TaxID=1679096 RepID=A0A2R4X196_9EURY|nr:DNA mismatch repair protein [Halococcoides cellulosivorans]AWB27572.1 DNA mismatch repair protein [Halococcoides cellulosivorans]
MDLESYWGIGPKTSARLREALGADRAREAIEAADVETLTAAGLSAGRVTRILRYAAGGAAMDLLATRDAREVYKGLLAVIAEYAVSDRAADRVRVLTPLDSRTAIEDRQAAVADARSLWEGLSEADRDAVLDAFADGGLDGDRATVRTAGALRAIDLSGPAVEALNTLDGAALDEAERALAALAGDPSDDRLATLREQRDSVADLAAAPQTTVEAIRDSARAGDVRAAFVDHVVSETGVDHDRVRSAAEVEATDAHAFVTGALDALRADLRAAVDERLADLRADHEDTLAETEATVERARDAVGDLALDLSVARFAAAFDLTAPTITDEAGLAVANARNLDLAAAGATVQPVTYAVGDHDLPAGRSSSRPPTGDRVAVLTGANSGGKTTLLETLCQVAVLARMGLPVPAEHATVGLVDRIVFHRRHASFNAGVLETTLENVVPPVTAEGRTLLLVDEFEAITEPGSAADLLNGLVDLTVGHDAMGVFVTHLADDLAPLPDAARIDGIVAEGLTPDLELAVDYQPRFDSIGQSTPEFIVSRLVANAGDGHERAGYMALAEAVGSDAVQRTLSDASWSE